MVAQAQAAVPTVSPTPAFASSPAGTVWEGYDPSIDRSIGCPAYPVRDSDVQVEYGDVLRLSADPGSGGVFVGAIAAKRYPFVNGSSYVLTGEFRKPSGNPEHIGVNLQYIDDESYEHYAEIAWGLNPYSPLYGWIWTRNDLDEQILLVNIGDDTNWHSFELTVHHGETHEIKSIMIDDDRLSLDLPIGRVKQEHKSSFAVLLEVENMYTDCNPRVSTRGVSEWRDIRLYRCVDVECKQTINLDHPW
jgi:hypothetical protein